MSTISHNSELVTNIILNWGQVNDVDIEKDFDNKSRLDVVFAYAINLLST